MKIAGEAVIILGLAFVAIGIIGLVRFKNFYARMLVTAKIDTVGMITILVGIAIKHGFSFFTLKTLLLMVLLAMITPLTSHTIARSAYLSGYKTESRMDNGNENKDYL